MTLLYPRYQVAFHGFLTEILPVQELSAVVAHSADEDAEELEMHRKINRQLSAGWAHV